MKQIFLHIGTHKTGSTSLQRWLREHESLLRENGYDLFCGQHSIKNHIELYLAAMRYERDSFAKQAYRDIRFDQAYTAAVADRVRRFLSESAQNNVIFTTEGLSLLRHADELDRLHTVLGQDAASIKVVVVLRQKADYLRSYRAQLLNKRGRKPARDYWSALYVEDDTWLTDYEGLLDAYGKEFGRENLCVIDYDKQMEARGNIIPSFLESIGLEDLSPSMHGLDSYHDNQTAPPRKMLALKRRARSVLRRLGIG